MAKLPNFRRLISSDYDAQYKPIIDRLGVSLNNAIESINDALNKKLSFQDNISSTIVDINITVDSDGVPTRPTSFKLDSKQTVVNGLLSLDARGSSDSSILPVAGVSFAFTKNEGYVTIDKVKGLIANIPYSIKVLCI